MIAERRKWYHISLSQVVMLLSLATAAIGFLLWTLKAAGVSPAIFPGERLDSIEARQSTVTDQLSFLEPLPQRVDLLAARVDTLTSQVNDLANDADRARTERVDMLYLLCELARRQGPVVILPSSCARIQGRVR